MVAAWMRDGRVGGDFELSMAHECEYGCRCKSGGRSHVDFKMEKRAGDSRLKSTIILV